MYATLLILHSIFRWLVAASLLYAIIVAYRGSRAGRAFTAVANRVRHWTATIAHIQLTVGFTLYFQSPVIRYFWSHAREAIGSLDTAFFAIIHLVLMLTAIVVITIGSALAKRREGDGAKYRTMLVYYSAAALLILIAIPWPFSPLAARPLIRLH